jgi:hypothetical protein
VKEAPFTNKTGDPPTQIDGEIEPLQDDSQDNVLDHSDDDEKNHNIIVA